MYKTNFCFLKFKFKLHSLFRSKIIQLVSLILKGDYTDHQLAS